jgi:hypothetical protein
LKSLESLKPSLLKHDFANKTPLSVSPSRDSSYTYSLSHSSRFFLNHRSPSSIFVGANNCTRDHPTHIIDVETGNLTEGRDYSLDVLFCYIHIFFHHGGGGFRRTLFVRLRDGPCEARRGDASVHFISRQHKSTWLTLLACSLKNWSSR